MKPLFLLFLSCLLFSEIAMAQLERRTVVADRDVELTFMAPRNINLYTIEALSEGELHYSIMHTFGEVNTGYQQFWGLDGGANVRFSLEYAFTDDFSLALGRSSLDKVVDFTGRYLIINQKSSGKVPVSVAANASVGINTTDLSFVAEPYTFSDRLSVAGSILVARKFSDKFSLQLSPTFVYFNRVGQELNVIDPNLNTYAGLGVSSRYKIRPRTAVTLQYVPTLYGDTSNYNLAAGIDIETGGHVFQMFFTTSRALNDQYLIAGENGNFFDREFRFGFNVNRIFNLQGR